MSRTELEMRSVLKEILYRRPKLREAAVGMASLLLRSRGANRVDLLKFYLRNADKFKTSNAVTYLRSASSLLMKDQMRNCTHTNLLDKPATSFVLAAIGAIGVFFSFLYIVNLLLASSHQMLLR